MVHCAFVSDLHGSMDRYRKLATYIRDSRPEAVFMGGDLLPHPMAGLAESEDTTVVFFQDHLEQSFLRLKDELGTGYPRIFLILGNDDPRNEEAFFMGLAERGLWEYVHGRSVEFGEYAVHGYSCVPPTPFQLKDWERYDVSRFFDPGCISPEEGIRSVPVSAREMKYRTIEADLERFELKKEPERNIFLFHTPPYETMLDRAALDGRSIDHAPLDVHVGSIAVRRFIEQHQPGITLHGHVHESARLTGSWQDRIGTTHAFSAAHDGPELALVIFDPADPGSATRLLL